MLSFHDTKYVRLNYCPILATLPNRNNPCQKRSVYLLPNAKDFPYKTVITL